MKLSSAAWNLFKRAYLATPEQATNYFRSNPKNFDHIFQKVEVLSLADGKCVAEMVVGEEHTNPMGGLHGGFSAALADMISSMGLSSLVNVNVPHVSVNLNLRYTKSCGVGTKIQIETETVKCGKTLAFLEILIKDKDTGDILVKGEHTKFILNPK